MTHSIEQKISKNIEQHLLLNDKGRVVVALSGGADSVALLSALVALGYDCIVAHCNFHLRGEESNRDEAHAIKLAQACSSKIEIKHFDVASYEKEYGVSTEMACRELRYEWFEQLRIKNEAQAIAVAHHRDDDVETMFLNLLRGSGIAGVAAMRWKNGYIVRPMLNISRQEIEQYLNDKRLDFVVDSTNAQVEYKRNRLRNIVMPVLRKAFPDADKLLAKSLTNLKENRQIYQTAISEAKIRYQKGSEIYLSQILEEYVAPTTLLFEMLNPLGFNFSQIEAIINERDETGRRFYSQKYVAVINRGVIELSEITDFSHREEEYLINLQENVKFPIELDVEQIATSEFMPSRDCREIYLDAKVLEGNPKFVLRRWKEGDRLAPFGMRGTKKLSDIFSDAKLSLSQKNKMWILERDTDILWIVGMRASRHFVVNESTTQILKVKLGK